MYPRLLSTKALADEMVGEEEEEEVCRVGGREGGREGGRGGWKADGRR